METSVYPLITLDEIVNDYLDQHQQPQSKYRRLMRMAVRGWRLFYRDSTGIPFQVTLPILANGTSVIPTNCISNILSIGVLNQRGEIASLSYDPLLSTTDSTSSSRYSQQTEQTLVDNDQMIFSLQDGINVGYAGYGGFGSLGVGSQPVIGFYNVDWGNRVIIYNFNTLQTEVIIEYLGAPVLDGNYAIHPFFQEAMVAWLNWVDSVGNPRKSKGERQLNQRDFDVQYANARRAMNPLNPSDIYNQVRQSSRLAPKS